MLIETLLLWSGLFAAEPGAGLIQPQPVAPARDTVVWGLEMKVARMAESVEFYRDGLDFEPERETEEASTLVNGMTRIELVLGHAPELPADGEIAGPYLNFVVRDMQPAIEQAVKAGARVISGPERFALGHSTRLADPDGYPFQLVELSARRPKDAPRCQVYHIAVRSADLERAEQAYTDLGLEPAKRKHLPRTLSLVNPNDPEGPGIIVHRVKRPAPPMGATFVFAMGKVPVGRRTGGDRTSEAAALLGPFSRDGPMDMPDGVAAKWVELR